MKKENILNASNTMPGTTDSLLMSMSFSLFFSATANNYACLFAPYTKLGLNNCIQSFKSRRHSTYFFCNLFLRKYANILGASLSPLTITAWLPSCRTQIFFYSIISSI